MIISKCGNCKRMRFWPRKRQLVLPAGQVATSREKLCTDCYKQIQAVTNYKSKLS